MNDLLLLPSLAACAVRRIPKKVWEENLTRAQDMWKDGRPKKWYYVLPVIAFYALLFLLLFLHDGCGQF